jgi:hypothetical protein
MNPERNREPFSRGGRLDTRGPTAVR